MNLRGTAALLAIFVALCLAYWGMLHRETRTKVRAVESMKLHSFAGEEVVAMEVQRAGEKAAAAKRTKGQGWTMTKPNASIQANEVLWTRVAANVAAMLNERTLEAKTDNAAKYGLDKPVLTLAAETADGKKVSYQFGSADPTETCRYAMAPEVGIFLVSNKTFQELDRPLDLLRNPYVVDVGAKGVNKIEFSRFWTERRAARAKEKGVNVADRKIGEESAVVTVEKQADGKWVLKTPTEGAANQELAEELAKQVQFATGSSYIDEPQNLKDYGLEPPECRVTVYSEGKEPQTLQFGMFQPVTAKAGEKKKEDNGAVFAKVASRPAVFLLDSRITGLLPESPSAFRENRLLTRQASQLKSLHYVAGESDVTLEYDGALGWSLVGAAPGETDQLMVSNLIGLLKALKGKGFPGDPKPEFGLEQPVVQITLGYSDSTETSVIKIGGKLPNTEQYYAMQDNGVVTLLNGVDVTALTKRTVDFRSKVLMEFPKASATRVSLKVDGTDYVFGKIRGEWRVLTPENKTLVSPAPVEALAETLSRANAVAAEDMTEKPDLTAYGLDAPVVVINVGFTKEGDAAESSVGPLSIGKPKADNDQHRYAMSTVRPGIYLVSQDLVAEVRETLKSVH